MTVYVALLRAINVGRSGKVSMTGLRELCRQAGFINVRTYIQSGNLVFGSRLQAQNVKARLRKMFAEVLPWEIGVALRTHEEMAKILRDNPFPDAAPNQVLVHFMEEPLAPDRVDAITPGPEIIRDHGRELYVYYPNGIGRSKLRLPASKDGTARNINTVAKLTDMAGET